ncbi:MAG: hypothetical protein LBI77_00480 [Puniceicoccales bacterium]|nr:hypothetical protein [Puniceicoccales bacterium]
MPQDFNRDCASEINDPNMHLGRLKDYQGIFNFLNQPFFSVTPETPLMREYNQFCDDIAKVFESNLRYYVSWKDIHPLRNLIGHILTENWRSYSNGKLPNRKLTRYAKIFTDPTNGWWVRIKNIIQTCKTSKQPLPGLAHASIGDIDRAFQEFKRENPPQVSVCPKVFIRKSNPKAEDLQSFKGVSDRDTCPRMVTLASRGLSVETSDPYKLKDDITDKTQGPGAALNSLGGMIARNAAVAFHMHPDSLLPVLYGIDTPIPRMCTNLLEYCKNHKFETYQFTNKFLVYGFGYLRPRNIETLPQLQALVRQIDNNISKYVLGMQWVRCEFAKVWQLQVFLMAADLSPRHSFIPNAGEKQQRAILCKNISKTLLVNQYKAVIQLACMRQEKVVHLTRVGQGVFRNDSSIMIDVLEVVLREAQGYDVHIYLEWDSWQEDLNIVKAKNPHLQFKWQTLYK